MSGLVGEVFLSCSVIVLVIMRLSMRSFSDSRAVASASFYTFCNEVQLVGDQSIQG